MTEINLELTSSSAYGYMAFYAMHEDEEKRLHVWLGADRKPQSVIHVNTFTGETDRYGRRKTKHTERSLYAKANRAMREAVEALTDEDFERAIAEREEKERAEKEASRLQAIEDLRASAAKLGFRIVPIEVTAHN